MSLTSTQPVRRADHPVDDIILNRWSPRAFDGSPIDDATLFSLFEAARWAPSAYNYQPWRFVHARWDDADWDGLLALLLPFNAAWAAQASALVFVLSDRLITPPGGADPVPAQTASFDAGAAWTLLAVQAARLGLHTHAMAGIDHVAATERLGAGERYRIEAAIAIGRIGDPAQLPASLQAREVPSQRRPVAELAFQGRLP